MQDLFFDSGSFVLKELYIKKNHYTSLVVEFWSVDILVMLVGIVVKIAS